MRTGARDRGLQQRLQELGDRVGGEHEDEDGGPPPEQREHERDREPDEPPRADARQLLERPVQPGDAVVDDPPLEVTVAVEDQTGTSALACSTSWCGSNGLPMKPLAPRFCASPAEPSTLPLNMITGIEP